MEPVPPNPRGCVDVFGLLASLNLLRASNVLGYLNQDGFPPA